MTSATGGRAPQTTVDNHLDIGAQINDHSAYLFGVSADVFSKDAALLHTGPVEAIVERIKSYIENFSRDGRCLIHLNQIPLATPSQHVHAAVAACHTYGRYPIAENLDDVQFEVPEGEDFSDFRKKIGA